MPSRIRKQAIAVPSENSSVQLPGAPMLPTLSETFKESLANLKDSKDPWTPRRRPLSAAEKGTFARCWKAAGYNLPRACKMMKIGVGTILWWIREDQDFKRLLDLIKLSAVSDVEEVLYKRALEPKATTDRVIWLNANYPEKYRPRQMPLVAIQQNFGDFESLK